LGCDDGKIAGRKELVKDRATVPLLIKRDYYNRVLSKLKGAEGIKNRDAQ
jgi:hypothetical protein